MALYLTQFSYTAEALAALAKNPQDRSAPVRELAQKSGGRLVGFYYCFGEVTVHHRPEQGRSEQESARGFKEIYTRRSGKAEASRRGN
jgi:uncharacterized protein with GYD domain